MFVKLQRHPRQGVICGRASSVAVTPTLHHPQGVGSREWGVGDPCSQSFSVIRGWHFPLPTPRCGAGRGHQLVQSSPPRCEYDAHYQDVNQLIVSIDEVSRQPFL